MTPNDPRNARDPWALTAEQFPRWGAAAERLAYLVRYAILAPSTRNTQPWSFRVGEHTVELRVDSARAQPVADADAREMFISAGCALENLLIAAHHFGYATQTDVAPDADDAWLAARVRFEPGEPHMSVAQQALFDAITARRTQHSPYDGTAVTQVDLEALSLAGAEPGIAIDWIYDEKRRADIDALVMRADALLFARPEYRRELGEWIGTGAFGTPWLLATLGKFAVSYLQPVQSFMQADHKAIVSSPAFGVISATEAGGKPRVAQVRSGQVLERLYLKATELGLALQPVSQLLQHAEPRAALPALLPAGRVALQPLRLGHAPPPNRPTPRRPMEDVVTNAQAPAAP